MYDDKYGYSNKENNNSLFIRTVWYVLGLFLCIAIPAVSHARTSSSQTGITVTPSIVKLDLKEASPEFSLTYSNTTSLPVEMTLKAEDFTALEEGWKVKFLDKEESSTYRYTLSSWIKFETTTLVLNPGETRHVKVFIDAERLSPGGHYASVLAEISQAPEGGHIGLRGVLSSLLFVRTASGNEHEEATVQSFSGQRQFFSFPQQYLMRFHNTGNVELTPYGLVEIKNMFGNTVARGILNEESFITLPESIRAYTITTASSQKFLFPGMYTAQLNLHYGNTHQELHQSYRFFSFGMLSLKYILLIASVIIVSIVFLRIRSHSPTV